ncbi:MAG: hypothetical protein RLZZ136_1680 [Pseudomonadota bacterium]
MRTSAISASIKAVLFGGTAIMALAAGPAWAEAASASSDEASSPADIVVTAQRRSEKLIEVPMSVVAISQESVAKSGVVSIHDINRLAPGVQINFAGCCTQPSIRGITTLTTGVGFENNIAIYVDGFYAPDNLSINGDMANLAGIEILKGPQGALWGRNATGGAILMSTKAPSDVLAGKLEVGFARYNESTVSGSLSGPISSKVRASISAYNRQSDGYYSLYDASGNLSGNADPIHQASVRAKVEVDLGANTKATIGGNYGLSSDGRGNTFTVTQYPTAALQALPFRATQPRTASGSIAPQARASLREGTLKIEHSADFGTLTSSTGYAVRKTTMAYDFDSSPLDLIISQAHWTQKTFQQSLDANVTSIAGINLVIGASYYNDHLQSLDQLGFGPFSGNARTESTLKAEALAGYFDGSVHLTDKLVFDVGARYTHENKNVLFAKYARVGGATITAPIGQSVQYNAFTPKASLRYEIADRTNVYASISRGFRTGGYNPNGPDANGFNAFRPEKVTSYELGFKTAKAMFQFETAGFYYDYKDLQVSQTQVLPSGGLINVVSNAPKAKVYGLDAMLTVQPIHNLNARIGVAYLHARYGAFANALGTGLNQTALVNVSNQIQDWTDKQMARAPDFSGNASVDYTIEGFAGGKLNLGTSVQFTSSFVPNNPSLYSLTATPTLNAIQRYRQDAYATMNLQASFSDMDERYKLTVYVNNATNKSYKMAYNGSGLTGDYAVWSQPITAGARVAVQF